MDVVEEEWGEGEIWSTAAGVDAVREKEEKWRMGAGKWRKQGGDGAVTATQTEVAHKSSHPPLHLFFCLITPFSADKNRER